METLTVNLGRVKMADIAQAIGLSTDAVNAAGYSLNDLLGISDAVEFLSKRTTPKGRWTVDKAKAVKTVLADLQKHLPAIPETPAAVIETHPETVEAVAPVSIAMRLFWAICIVVVVAHAGLIWYDAAKIWGTAGIFGGGLAFLIQCAALLIASQPDQQTTSEWALFIVCAIDLGAWFLHYPTFLSENRASVAVVSEIQTGFMAAFICAFSFGALYMFRNSNIN